MSHEADKIEEFSRAVSSAITEMTKNENDLDFDFEMHNNELVLDKHDPDDRKYVLHSMDVLAMTWLGPIFFVTLGTRMVFVGNWQLVADSLGQVIAMFSGMLILQFFSASLAARYVPGGFNFVESVMIGFGMLGRAELAFVVLDICFVQNHIIDQKAFYMLMFTCFLLNVVTPMFITWWKPYYMGEKIFPFFMNGEAQRGGMTSETEKPPIRSPSGSPAGSPRLPRVPHPSLDSMDLETASFSLTNNNNNNIIVEEREERGEKEREKEKEKEKEKETQLATVEENGSQM